MDRLFVFVFLFTVGSSEFATAQNLGSLKRVAVPQPSNLDQYVQDHAALVLMGKALFWDMQAGGDGRVACAPCHFHAGADHRVQNQLSNFGNAAVIANGTLALSAFPFHVLSNTASNRSTVVRDSAAVFGSAGVFSRFLTAIVPGSPIEMGYDLTDTPAFNLGGINTRQVGTRNAPTVINTVFNVRNFWDGRASDIQAAGPALNSVEMSYEGRSWPQIGKKMLSLRPLALQRVAPDDSVLGAYAVAEGAGLQADSYRTLTEAAFLPSYWNSDQLVDATGTLLGRSGPPANQTEFTVAEYNFGLFWGLAIQAYESTLVSDDSRMDQFFDGNTAALTAVEQQGLRLFQGGATDCTNCHAGAELTLASFSGLTQNGGRGRGGQTADPGFFRTGVRHR